MATSGCLGRLARADETRLVGDDHGLCPVAGVELGEDVKRRRTATGRVTSAIAKARRPSEPSNVVVNVS